MKKILKKEVIIAFIIGIILASSIAVYAYSYAAKDVSYTKPGTDTTIDVETALNDLYSKFNTNQGVICAKGSLTTTTNNIDKVKIDFKPEEIIVYGYNGNTYNEARYSRK
jgi:hypothetical protein